MGGGEEDLIKGYWNSKRKLGIATYFSEIIIHHNSKEL